MKVHKIEDQGSALAMLWTHSILEWNEVSMLGKSILQLELFLMVLVDCIPYRAFIGG